jgi:glutamate synthase (ferredoxin)
MEEPEMEQEFDIPHDFKKVCDFTIPAKRASMQWNGVFYQKKTDFCKTTFETAIRNQNLILSDGEMFLSMFQIWTNRSRKEPIKQVFIGKNGLELTEQQFNAKLFAAKIAEHTILNSKTSESHMFYF